MVSSLLTERGRHEREQREPQRHEHTHVAQTVVAVQLVHQEDLKEVRGRKKCIYESSEMKNAGFDNTEDKTGSLRLKK